MEIEREVRPNLIGNQSDDSRVVEDLEEEELEEKNPEDSEKLRIELEETLNKWRENETQDINSAMELWNKVL